MKTIQWGIIGCGDVTEIKSGPAFQLADNSALAAVMRRNGKLAEDYANRHNVPKWYDDADQLIDDENVDAVYIATPPSFHKEYTIKAAKAGKHIYVEKPMALNYEECLEMISVCNENNVPLFVAYYRRMLPKFLRVKEIISSGALGRIKMFSVILFDKSFERDKDKSNWRVNPEVAGGGYFVDLASHTIDILQYFFGDFIRVEGTAVNQNMIYKAEDCVSAIFETENKILGTGLWNFGAFRREDRVEIIGDKGQVTFSVFFSDKIIVETAGGTDSFIIKNPKHIQQPLIQTIVDELNGSGKCPSTGVTASKTSWVMDKILNNYYGRE
ncbi:MAG: Gfo/Idh/MocA family oxidoreductase [Bacteroidetes bacterium]|nr:Gfo/Idh/MocA family oxidoreductase [Bacteroidota bacterium]